MNIYVSMNDIDVIITTIINIYNVYNKKMIWKFLNTENYCRLKILWKRLVLELYILNFWRFKIPSDLEHDSKTV